MTRPDGLCVGTMLPVLLLALVACVGVQGGERGDSPGGNGGSGNDGSRNGGNGGNGGGSGGGCTAASGRLKPLGVCAAGEDECPFQLTLPQITLQLPRSFRTLEKGQREVQSLKQEVALLKGLHEEEVANLTQLQQEVQQLRSVKLEEESSSYRKDLPSMATPDLSVLKEEVTRAREEVMADLQQLREEVEQLRSLKEEVLQLRQCCESSRSGSQFLNMLEDEPEKEDEEDEELEEVEEEVAQQDQPGGGDHTPPGKGEANPTMEPSKSRDPTKTKDPAKTKDTTHTTPDSARKLRDLQRELSGLTRGLRNATTHIAQLEERLSQLQTDANATANTSQPCSNYCPAHAPAPLTMVTARDCSDYAVMGRRQDGVYRVSPDPRLGGAVPVWCDMASLGGGWTVIQRRANGTESFNRSWADYKKGFGELGGDLWLGLELVHWLTRGRDMVLRIELQDSRGRQEYAKYEQFYVAGEQLRYKLSVGGYSGTAGDALTSGEGGSGSGSFRHDQMFFSTADRDNDAYTKGSCASYYGSGWWFNACMAANLNGRHYRQRYRGVRNGIFWSTWPNATGTHEPPLTGYRDAFRYAKMMIRPRNYSP